MEGMQLTSNRDGKATVIATRGNKSWVVEWENSGHRSVVQKDAGLKGIIRDGSKFGKVNEDRCRVEEVFTLIEADKQAVIDAELSRAASVAAHEEGKQLRAEERKQVAITRKAARAATTAANTVKAVESRKRVKEEKVVAEVATWKMDESTPRKNVIEVDFKDRAGFWVLQFNGPNGFTSTRLGKLHNNVSSRAKQGGSCQTKYNRSYDGVNISPLFADAQTFCDWAVEQPGWGLGWQLDKDLLATDTRQYSEGNCVFVPRVINMNVRSTPCKNRLRVIANFYRPRLDPRAYARLVALST